MLSPKYVWNMSPKWTMRRFIINYVIPWKINLRVVFLPAFEHLSLFITLNISNVPLINRCNKRNSCFIEVNKQTTIKLLLTT